MTRPRTPLKKINGEALKYQIKVKRLNQEWISEALGKNKSFVSKCISLGRMHPQAIREIEKMYRIPASVYVIEDKPVDDLFQQLSVQLNESAPDPMIAPDPEPVSEKSQRKVSEKPVQVSVDAESLIVHQRELINQQTVTIDQLLRHIKSITSQAKGEQDESMECD